MSRELAVYRMTTYKRRVAKWLVTMALYFCPVFVNWIHIAYAANIEVTPSDSRNEIGRHTFVNIELYDPIYSGDAKKFEDTIRPYLDPVYTNVETRGYIRLSLDSEGYNYEEALKIARIVKEENISTVVKKSAFCKSACAFIFMAGRNLQYGMDPVIDRTLQIGGDLGFHSPYPDNGDGTFAQAIQAIIQLRQTLGNVALPDDLFIKLLETKPDDFVTIRWVWDALRWKISLKGYKPPSHTREELYNACVNDAAWNTRRPLFGRNLTGGVETTGKDGFFLADPDGQVRTDNRYGPININNYLLRKEHDPTLVMFRKVFSAPDLMKLVNIGHNSVATQYLFDFEDEQGRLWCTVWTLGDSQSLAIVPRKLQVDQLLAGAVRKTVFDPMGVLKKWRSALGRASPSATAARKALAQRVLTDIPTSEIVPDWYEYAPGRSLRSISNESAAP
jgi:hypothetical protein